MKFKVEITIRTTPEMPRTEVIESALLPVEASTYSEALERTFAALKTCNTFREFMDMIENSQLIKA